MTLFSSFSFSQRCRTDNLWTLGNMSLYLCCHWIAEWLTLTNAVNIPPSQTTGSSLTIAAESWQRSTPSVLQRILPWPVEAGTKGYQIIKHRQAFRASVSAQHPHRLTPWKKVNTSGLEKHRGRLFVCPHFIVPWWKSALGTVLTAVAVHTKASQKQPENILKYLIFDLTTQIKIRSAYLFNIDLLHYACEYADKLIHFEYM